MLYVPVYTHVRRPYSDTLYPTSFNLDSSPAPRIICVLRKIYGLCFTLGPTACGGFFRVTLCFGTIGEEGLLGNRWAHRWIQQTLEEY